MQRFIVILGVCCALFSIVLAAGLIYRMPESTVQILTGASIGILVAAPCGLTVGWLLRASRSNETTNYHIRVPASQPQYELPQQYQAYPMQPSQQFPQLGQQMYPQLPARRHFVVGDDGEMKEL